MILVKVSTDPNFMEKGYELKHVEFFRAVAGGLCMSFLMGTVPWMMTG